MSSEAESVFRDLAPREEFELIAASTALLDRERNMQPVSDHQIIERPLSATPNREQSTGCLEAKDAIRYHRLPLATHHDLHLNKQCKASLPRSKMADQRSLAFVVAVCYAILSIAVASATLGYRQDVRNEDYGFRAIMEGTALLSTITFIVSLGLIYGIMERRTGFVSAWLAVHMVVPLYTSVFYLWAIFASGNKTVFGPVRNAMPTAAMAGAVHILLMLGSVIIVNNYYTFLKTRESVYMKTNSVYESV